MNFNRIALLTAGAATAITLSTAPLFADETEDGVVTEYYSGGPDIRFKVRNLKMWVDGDGTFTKEKATKHLSSPFLAGKTLEAEIEYFHDCQKCGNAINQILIGIVDTEVTDGPPETRAVACIYNGGRESHGWQKARFQIPDLPNADSDFDVRVRYAQDYSCNLAMKAWWTIDKEKKGPRKENTVGSIDTFP